MRIARIGIALMLIGVCLWAAAASAEEVGGVVINEVMASNGTYKNSHAYDWVELYNGSGQSVDLSGWNLSDSKKNPEKFTFPAGTTVKKGGYLLVYCTGDERLDPGKGDTFYAPFKLSASGDKVVLTDPAGAQAVLEFGQQYGNISYGVPAGGAGYGFFETATPNAANGKTVCAARERAPVIDTAGGF